MPMPPRRPPMPCRSRLLRRRKKGGLLACVFCLLSLSRKFSSLSACPQLLLSEFLGQHRIEFPFVVVEKTGGISKDICVLCLLLVSVLLQRGGGRVSLWPHLSASPLSLLSISSSSLSFPHVSHWVYHTVIGSINDALWHIYIYSACLDCTQEENTLCSYCCTLMSRLAVLSFGGIVRAFFVFRAVPFRIVIKMASTC